VLTYPLTRSVARHRRPSPRPLGWVVAGLILLCCTVLVLALAAMRPSAAGRLGPRPSRLAAATIRLGTAPARNSARTAVSSTPRVVMRQTLVPATTTIRLHPGDTLWALARRYGTTVPTLQHLNHLGTATLIYADATLLVPARPDAAPATLPATAHVDAYLRVSPTHTTATTPQTPTPATPVTATARPPVPGTAQQIAAEIFGNQYSCAAHIIDRESGWNLTATNPSTGAYGLPQALPASKMAAAGADWATNPATQLRWMHIYVTDRYGGACAAWAFWQAHRWY
jgi:LysM repeat protein